MGDDARKHVQRSGAEATRIEHDVRETSRAHRVAQLRSWIGLLPMLELRQIHLDTRRVPVVANAKIARNAELPQRTLGALHGGETDYGDRRSIRKAR